MKNSIKVLVDDTREFELDMDGVEKLDLIKESESSFHLLLDNQAYRAKLDSSAFDERVYTIIINSNPYKVRIKSSIDTLIKEMGYSIGSSKVGNSIKAPMPGIIIGIHVEKGQAVKEGETLLILEAMKMENALLCPKDGTIKELTVQIGDTVDKNKLLVELE